jgi:3-hydroxymyristoyl/3-hydroxydecanoyl-(acyl carrier protein) dehydratase
MRTAPFVARWRLGTPVGGAFDAQMVLDDPAMFAGHYPGAPIFPGTFLIESLFQAASAAVGGALRLEQIVACRFRSPLFPGDELSAHFALKDAGTGRILVEVSAQGRAPAAQLSLLMASGEGSPNPVGFDPAIAPGARELDAAFVASVLPHRPPALLVEHAVLVDQSRLVAYKSVTSSEPCGPGSCPRSLVVESFCQSCGLLRAATAERSDRGDEAKVPVVAKLANLQFFGDAVAGDRLEHHVSLVARTPDGAVFSGHTAVFGRVILQIERVVAAMAPISSPR